MSLRPLASVAVKIVGLYLALASLPLLALVAMPFVVSYKGGSPLVPAFVNMVSGAIQISVGLALWWFSDGIADVMVKQEDGPTSSPWTELAFALLGLYFAVDAVSQLVRVAGVLLLINYPPNITVMPPDNLTPLVRDAIPQLIRGGIGLWILLGAKGLARGILELRNIGRDPDSPLLP